MPFGSNDIPAIVFVVLGMMMANCVQTHECANYVDLSKDW